MPEHIDDEELVKLAGDIQYMFVLIQQAVSTTEHAQWLRSKARRKRIIIGEAEDIDPLE